MNIGRLVQELEVEPVLLPEVLSQAIQSETAEGGQEAIQKRTEDQELGHVPVVAVAK